MSLRPYPVQLTMINFFYTTEQSKVKGLAQQPSSCSLAVRGFELMTFDQKFNVLTTEIPLPVPIFKVHRWLKLIGKKYDGGGSMMVLYVVFELFCGV